jgi:plasmid stabilization system protein ParE
LGTEFVAAVLQVIALIERLPEAGRTVHRDVRRIRVRRFPYAIYYRVSGSMIKIRGCLHDHRRTGQCCKAESIASWLILRIC